MNTEIETIALNDDALEQVNGAYIGAIVRGAKIAYNAVKTVAKSPYGKGLATGWSLSDLFSGSDNANKTA